MPPDNESPVFGTEGECDAHQVKTFTKHDVTQLCKTLTTNIDAIISRLQLTNLQINNVQIRLRGMVRERGPRYTKTSREEMATDGRKRAV